MIGPSVALVAVRQQQLPSWTHAVVKLCCAVFELSAFLVCMAVPSGSSFAVAVAGLYFVIALILASALSIQEWAYNVAHCPSISMVVQLLMGMVSYDRLETDAVSGLTSTASNNIYTGNTALESKAQSSGFVGLALGCLGFLNCLCSVVFCIGLSRGSLLSGKFALLASCMSSVFLTGQCGATPLLKGSAEDVVAYVQYYVNAAANPSSVTSELGSGFAMSFCCACLSYVGSSLLAYDLISRLHYRSFLRLHPVKGADSDSDASPVSTPRHFGWQNQ